MEPENERLPERHVSEMTQEDLDYLSGLYTTDGYSYANFNSLWSSFIGESPDAEEVYSFFEDVEDLGYFVKEEVEHPYAQEWAGSDDGEDPRCSGHGNSLSNGGY